MSRKIHVEGAATGGVRIPTHRPPTHPGVLLREEFLIPLGRRPYEFAERLGVSRSWMESFLNGRESLTPDLAERLSRLTGPSPAFWMNFQRRWEGYGESRLPEVVSWAIRKMKNTT
ncbi:MAG: HigA family addiction module antitoxin [Desulfococcaceae bacterium]